MSGDQKRPKTKKQLRDEARKAAQKKQLEEAYKYPFCRRCRTPLEPEWARKLKAQGQMPLCEGCFGPMMALYKQNIEKFAKMMSGR